MKDIVTSEEFLTIGVALLAPAIGIFLRYVTRNDRHRSVTRNDWAVGLDIMVAATIILITNAINNFSKLNQPDTDPGPRVALNDDFAVGLWSVLAMVLIAWGTSTIIRKVGWDNEQAMNLIWGILLPNVAGVIMLLYVFKNFKIILV